jgi:hypothetical protein
MPPDATYDQAGKVAPIPVAASRCSLTRRWTR